jgi:hypothetical protein
MTPNAAVALGYIAPTQPQPEGGDAWERFMSHEPLTPELDEAMRGRTAPIEPEERRATRADRKDPDRELLQEERQALHRLIAKRDPGWEVVLRIEERLLNAIQRSAMVLSEQNPLRNQESVATAWANVGLLKDLRKTRDRIIEEELANLEHRTPKKRARAK